MPFWCAFTLLNLGGPLARLSADDPSPTPDARSVTDDAPVHPLNIQVPLVLGEPSKNLKLPEYSLTGTLLSFLKAATVKKLDADHLQMEKMLIDLYKPNGQLDFSIDLPTSSFNVKTRIIASVDPVTITSPEFVLTGERMKFDTYTREAQLLGHVKTRIFHLKSSATIGPP